MGVLLAYKGKGFVAHCTAWTCFSRVMSGKASNEMRRMSTPISETACGEPLHPQIIKELRWRVDARHEQMIPGSGAGDIQQVPFGVIDFF
jgi:hypothetical protein